MTTQRNVKIGIAAVIIAAVVVVGVASYYFVLAPEEEVRPIKIGSVFPITGAAAEIGDQMREACILFEEQINEAGGIDVGGKRYPVEIVYGDTEGKIEAAVAVVEKLITQDKVDVFVGNLYSSLMLNVMDIYERNAVPAIASCTGSTSIYTRIGEENMKYVFQLGVTFVDEIDARSTVVAAMGYTKWAIMSEDSDTGRTGAKWMKEMLAEKAPQMQLLAEEYVEIGTEDLYTELLKFRDLGVEYVFTYLSPPSCYRWFEQAHELGMTEVGSEYRILSHTVSGTVEWEAEHPEMVEGMLGDMRFIPGEYTEMSLPFLQAFRERFGHEPLIFSIQQYGALHVMKQAIEMAGSLDRDKIAEALDKETFVDPWGIVDFTEGTHMNRRTVGIGQIRDGKRYAVYPWHAAEKKLWNPRTGKDVEVP